MTASEITPGLNCVLENSFYGGVELRIGGVCVFSQQQWTCFANQVRSRADGCAPMKNRGEGDTISGVEGVPQGALIGSEY